MHAAHSILGVALVLVLHCPLAPLVSNVLARLPKKEGQQALHFCAWADDAGCTLAREGIVRQETEFGGVPESCSFQALSASLFFFEHCGFFDWCAFRLGT